MRGKGTSRRTPQDAIERVRSHINSFPRVPSHYCRSSSTKKYLEPGLSLTMMYELYCEVCDNESKVPVKLSMYPTIFQNEFNISFKMPKKDRCDRCELYANDTACDEKYQAHILDKTHSKTERNKNRKSPNTATICVDLQNVITLPKAEIKDFFYKRKLNVYNLTAHFSVDKHVYNAIWCEATAGRGANEIASALCSILQAVKSGHPDIKEYTLWSESCVPQNRNSVMTYALKRFMSNHGIDRITQKLCCPGHSNIQKVDNVHSHIEKVLKTKEVFSPVSLVRALKTVRRKALFRIIQMQKHNFVEFQKSLVGLKFNAIPHTCVKSLQYERSLEMFVFFKLSFADESFRETTIYGKPLTRNSGSCKSLPVPKMSQKVPVISAMKKKDLCSMLPYMSEVDRRYYEAKRLCGDCIEEPQQKKQCT